ncbi:MAG: MBL fold metallo-hydrolase [Flavobacteriales bacterium]|nr:MBL fold metallo-hydrolase [Flavobacteriales bacterium]
MTVTFLGTGTSQGVPVIACECPVCSSKNPKDNRLRSSIMITRDGQNVVVDSGPDFRQQMLREKVKAIAGIVFTHEHKDHIAGLDEVRAFNYFNQWRAQVYCSALVEAALRREFAYAFAEMKYPGIPEIDLNHITLQPFEVAGIPFTPIEVLHFKLPVFAYRIGDFTYITDANAITDEEKAKIKGTKILVLNALRREKHPSHFNLEEAIALSREIGAETTWLTHISHQLGLHDEVQRELPSGIHLAWDGLKIEIPT